jgi:hypothetical protein
MDTWKAMEGTTPVFQTSSRVRAFDRTATVIGTVVKDATTSSEGK